MSTPSAREQKLLEDLQRFPNIFSKLTAEGQSNEQLIATAMVSGYSGLVFLSSDILKAVMFTLEADCPTTNCLK